LSRPSTDEFEAGVLEELRALLLELGSTRAIASIRPDASLERDLGLGSLERVELLSRLEKRFRLKAPTETLGRAETANELAAAFASDVKPGEAGRAGASSAIHRRPEGAAELSLPSGARSLGEVLAERAASTPAATHLFVKADDGPERMLTYGALYREALLVAGGLREQGIGRGDKVAIMLPTSVEFFSAYMGTLFAGAVPVPLYPPVSLSRLGEYARRQAKIVDNAEARCFVTFPRARPVGELLRKQLPRLLEVVSVDELLASTESFSTLDVSAEDPALIQYTSGSTGDPKGVLLTHGNLLSNVRAIGRALRIVPSDFGVSWLPLYHDMGLIGAWFVPLYFGIPVAISSPLAFLARPENWLWTIHARRGTISPAPNFAYEIAARKISDEDLEGLDLSSWRVALNGAEPVLPETIERFACRFGPYGFHPGSMLPVYGLAESSLLLAAPTVGAEARVESVSREAFERDGVARKPALAEESPITLVSVGRPVEGHEVRIVDDDGRDLPERHCGHIVFRGPSTMKGYYRNESATADVSRRDRFLDSGDRGFFAEGNLFIAGREKDLIIRAGRNLLPQEIERVAGDVEGVRRGSVAAFGAPDPATGTERLVIVAETRIDEGEERNRIEANLERRVTEEVGTPPDTIILVPPRSLPKTSSGKLRRSACRERYLRGEIGRVPATPYLLALRMSVRAFQRRLESLWLFLRRCLYGLYAYPLTLAFVVPYWVLASTPLPARLWRASLPSATRWYLRLLGAKLVVEGLEQLEKREGPFIFVANHASYLDLLPLMATFSLDYAFVVKREASGWPIISTFIRRLGHLAIERSETEESSTQPQRMRALLDNGCSLVIFPEGTFSYATGIRPFRLGAFRLAADTSRPLTPVALAGMRRFLRDGTWLPRPGPIQVKVGEPVRVGHSLAEIAEAREQIASYFANESREPRLDLVSAGIPKTHHAV
jgi:fatty-acyl-CoA synthase